MRVSSVGEAVSPSEPLSRFILQRGQYRSSDNKVKYSAFMPAKDGKTSVYRVMDLLNQQIWKLGQVYVADKRRMPLLGRADIITSRVNHNGLEVESAPKPHNRHANIINWPADKGEKRLIAMELASAAKLNLKQSK